MADNVEIDGLVKEQKQLEALMMSNPEMEKRVQKLVRQVLMTVRRAVAQQAKGAMKSDPRQAYKAVKTAVYRQILGGSVSILNKRRGSTQFSDYEPPRKLRTGQRGGNRRTRTGRTSDLIHYAGPDRAFILRFLNAGTTDRGIEFTYDESRKVSKWNKHPNTGNRGRIRARGFFATSSHQAMRKAADELTKLIDNLIKQETR
jgi:hypothetical protein